MRIGIYDCYWSTLGGGERYAATMAEILARQHEVELIGFEPMSLEHLGGHLGLDLSNVSFRRWDSEPAEKLSERTAEYDLFINSNDLFINSTFYSSLRSQAERSAYIVYFPQPLMRGGLGESMLALSRRLAGDQTPAITPVDGFYRAEGAHQWSKERSRIQLSPKLFRHGTARIHFPRMTPWPLEEALIEVRGEGLSWSVDGEFLSLALDEPTDRPVEIEIVSRSFSPSEQGGSGDRRTLGVCLSLFASIGPFQRFRRRAGAKLHRRMERYEADFLDSYPLLLAISEYTQSWTERRWGRSSEILAPPVDTEIFATPPGTEKEKVILSVGRFFHGEHNKKHVPMLHTFRKMCDRGLLPDGWELRLAGNVHRNRLADMEYYAEVERLAEDYPVKLLPDLAFSDLKKEYHRAAIFWHATGWGEPEHRRPEKLEHFGLTTCEAMSAGCIPVVISKAGQLEIVKPGESGFLFDDESDLIGSTTRLTRAFGEPWTTEMRQRAVQDVKRYSLAAFEDRLVHLLAPGSKKNATNRANGGGPLGIEGSKAAV